MKTSSFFISKFVQFSNRSLYGWDCFADKKNVKLENIMKPLSWSITAENPYGEYSVRQKLLTAKIPYSKNYVRRKLRTTLNPYGENSVRQNSVRRKFWTVENSIGREILRRKFLRRKFLRQKFQPRLRSYKVMYGFLIQIYFTCWDAFYVAVNKPNIFKNFRVFLIILNVTHSNK